VDQDRTGSFVTLKDVVDGLYIGWDSEDGRLIRVDGAVTTRNML
jgi:hypothetical protein